MKKNIILLLPLIATTSAFSMEQSTIMTPVPTERGLGILRKLSDLTFGEEENLYADLVNKNYNPHNSSYPRKLDVAVETFVTKKIIID